MTWRYSAKHDEVRKARTLVSEKWLSETISNLTEEVRRNGMRSFRPIGPFAGWEFAQTKSIRLMCICFSLSLRKRNKHGKTVTAHVNSKVN